MSAQHASAVRLDGIGVLIRGPSGAGKSRLALALLDQAKTPSKCIKVVTDKAHQPPDPLPLDACSTALIGDDYLDLDLDPASTDLIASPAKALEGLVELRGLGILSVPWCARAPIHLIVDLLPLEAMVRLPQNTVTTVAGRTLDQLTVPIGDLAHQLLLVRVALQILPRVQ